MAFQPFSNSDIRKFFAFFWLFAFLILQLTFQIFFDVFWGIAFADNTLSIIFMVLCIGLSNKNDFVAKMSGYQLIPLILFITFLSAIEVALSVTILYYLNANNTVYHEFLFQSLPFRFLYSWFIILGFTFMNFVWNKASQRDEELKKAENLRKMAKDAELDKIYQQLHPHFLFNSLNAINTLIVSKPDKASEMVQNLSDFLRGSLKRIDEKDIPFQSEINHLSLYLELEKIRFGERLHPDFQIKKNVANASIPPLILQPLIENAIKFGLYGTLGKVDIQLEAFCIGGYLFILITNPFDEEASPPKGTGFGLKSVKRRLFLIYGRDDLIQTHTRKNKFVTTLKIPQSNNAIE